MTYISPCEEIAILLVDDDPVFAKIFIDQVQNLNVSVKYAPSVAEMRRILSTYSIHTVLLDVLLGNENGIDLIGEIRSSQPEIPIFMISGQSNLDFVMESIRNGAKSYVLKTDKFDWIIKSIRNYLFPYPPPKSSSSISDIDLKSFEDIGLIAKDPLMISLLESVVKFRDLSVNLLLEGETGSGKEIIAKAMHYTSARSHSNFEAVNCGAIPEQLLESMLFGYKKGAFTDAKSDHIGLFERCDGGTIFLDEIGEMPLHLQVKILRVIQEQEIRPLGSNTSKKIKTRVIAATHRDLKKEVAGGRFREDLFYRLAILKVRIPPLRERIQDIPHFIRYFLNTFNQRYHKNVRYPLDENLLRLQKYSWPGNVRELSNAVERAVLFAQDDEMKIEDFFDEPMQTIIQIDREITSSFSSLFSETLHDAREKFQKEYLQRVLAKSRGNIGLASDFSGLCKPNLYRLLKLHSISIHKFRFTS